ncbi:phytanoyl-CoA dioxygenase family protein [Halocynthiibacter sp. C4]|uniref:phytanoyl-CoA dioxygenase family protein n=1 Tax=Halocynthiibacter sp. C4 TaxID=2992758 RepID=UPI00237C437E|nr:phytanoyl-CoA dioxygenase family protein [Halocynthiibacter sp. C4]MDE0589693.1 phytanoyl-CoA dioxygenase family protein [Halocynthiibacter sp. C4]
MSSDQALGRAAAAKEMPATKVPTGSIIESARAEYEETGFCVLPNIIPDDLLSLLRDECQGFIDRKHAEMDAAGTDSVGISHRGRRYFVERTLQQSTKMAEFLFSPLMAGICRDILGPDAWLFYDQYVVKGADPNSRFAWHQDSGYVAANGGDPKHKPYLTCWCTLDDVTEENGTVYMLPYDKAGTRDLVEHQKDPEMNDWVGYHGDEPGTMVIAPAGSIALFSSMTFHRSGPNLTNNMRRVYLAQYSAEPIKKVNSDELWGQSIPFLRDGVNVAGGA